MEQNTTPTHAPHDPHSPQLPHKKRQKLLILSIIGVIVLIFVTALIAFMVAKNQTVEKQSATGGSRTAETDEEADETFAREYLQGCQERTVAFTHSPLPLDQLGFIEPMGKTNDGHVTPTDHVYIAPSNRNAADNTYDVVMPADGTITTVAAMPAQYIGDRQQQTASEDHRIIIAHNCQFVSIFIHVHQLSPAIQGALGNKLSPNEQKRISLELKAGDKIGKIGGNPVDWSLIDAKKTLSGFISPKLYVGEPWKVHVIDPIAAYSGELKTTLISKSLRSQEPYGGKIDYDKKGALVGNWFKEGTNGYAGADQSRYWDGHLSIAPNYIDPTATTVSLGNWQGKAAQFTATATSPDPATVTAQSGIVKYSLVPAAYTTPAGQPWTGNELAKGIALSKTGPNKGVMLVKVLEGEKLQVELFPDKTAAQVNGFTAAVATYER